MESQQIEGTHASRVAGDGDVIRVLGSDGIIDAARDPKLPRDLLHRIWEVMTRSRLLDARLAALSDEGAIGYYPAGRGEEAAVVVAAAAFRDDDWLVSAPRTTGAFLWRGVTIEALVAHAFGNADDPSRGRRMPGHPTARAHRITSASTLKGAQLGQATGLAWAARIKGHDVAVGVWLDDTEVEANDFHTGVNFAGVFRTPTVFICRSRNVGDETVADKGVAYGVPAVRADGADPLAVWVAVREGVEQAAAGRGPTLIELLTPRATDLDADADPIGRLGKHLKLGASDRAAAEKAAAAQIESAIAAARRRALPERRSLIEDVLREAPAHLRDQARELID